MKKFFLCTAFILKLLGGAFGQESDTGTPKMLTKREQTEAKAASALKDLDEQAADAGAAQSVYTRPGAKVRAKRFANSVVGPIAIGRLLVGAGISTWRNSPREWGDRWEGFGRRTASNFGRNVIRQTTTYGLDEALRYDSAYYRSRNKSIGARLRNALLSPVTARDRAGRRVLGIPRLAGTYTSSIVAYETWYPSRYDWKDGVRSGTISLGFSAAINLFKEFVWKK